MPLTTEAMKDRLFKLGAMRTNPGALNCYIAQCYCVELWIVVWSETMSIRLTVYDVDIYRVTDVPHEDGLLAIWETLQRAKVWEDEKRSVSWVAEPGKQLAEAQETA